MQKKILLGAGLAVLLMPGLANALGLELAVGGWQQNPQGTIAYKPLTVGDSIDLEKEAGYQDATKVMGRAKIDMPLFLPNIYLMATPMQFEANGNRASNFQFGNKTFSADVDFYSELTLDHYDVGLYYGIPFIEMLSAKTMAADLGIDFRIMDINARVRQSATGFDESVSETFVMPMIYAGLKVRPMKWLALEAEARGISYNANHYYDFIGRLKLSPLPTPFRSLFVAGGWRYEDIAIDEKSIKAEVKFSGPFLEAGVDF